MPRLDPREPSHNRGINRWSAQCAERCKLGCGGKPSGKGPRSRDLAGRLTLPIPYDQGGRTCKCDLGGGCRKHHILKQNPRWKLDQTRPGEFTWTTPGGRTYAVGPDTYPL
jgi:hypothetical protein